MEFRPMRRKRQELPKEECKKILNNATAGVLSVLGDGGYPYGVPISYVYAEGKLYFHSAVEGHKLDAIALVRSFRPIPIDEFDNIAQLLI